MAEPQTNINGLLEQLVRVQSAMADSAVQVYTELSILNSNVVALTAAVERIANSLSPPPIVGITAFFTPNEPPLKEQQMKILAKKFTAQKSAKLGIAASTQSLGLSDNGNGTATVWGVDQAGNPVPLDSTVTITVTSDDPTVATVGTPAGATFPYGAATSPPPAIGAKCNYTITATWATNPPADSPFTDTVAVTIGASPIGGVNVNFG